ncbi:hypothetical protein D3M59_10735 [Sphingomonas edaphi]|uniref:VanZ family protein n=2 Tax=Sphingomonas edaphi TaxID=2315689 RepID=A0A418PY62_9SPHN|nr:hypothetical protein D3M59_10735 [Sphingomonas edaphi]
MKILFRLLLLAAIAGTLVLALMPSPPPLLGPDTDPTKHAIGMLAVMMLAGFAFPQTSLLMILASVAVGSGVLEFVQGTPPFMRDPDPYDWIAGMIGAGAGFILLLIVRLLIQLSNRIVSKRNTLGS